MAKKLLTIQQKAKRKALLKRNEKNAALIEKMEAAGRVVAAFRTLELALKGVAELYPADASGPGMCLAYLRGNDQFYASLLRYDGHQGTGKQVLIATTQATLQEAITELVDGWVNRTQNIRQLHSRGLGAKKAGRRRNDKKYDWNNEDFEDNFEQS